MSKPGTVYGIGYGEYSDYYVAYVFERKEDAEAYNEATGGKGYVEDFKFAPAGYTPPLVTVYEARSDDCGEIAVRSSEETDWAGELTNELRRPKVMDHRYRTGNRITTARSINRDAAIKSVKDRIMQHKALNEDLAGALKDLRPE